jgi:hypothetical protein
VCAKERGKKINAMGGLTTPTRDFRSARLGAAPRHLKGFASHSPDEHKLSRSPATQCHVAVSFVEIHRRPGEREISDGQPQVTQP